MGDVGPRSLPQGGEYLGDTEGQCRAETGGDDAVARISRRSFTARKEQTSKQGHEEELTVEGDELQDVLDSVAFLSQSVQRLVETEVHADSLGASSTEFRRFSYA